MLVWIPCAFLWLFSGIEIYYFLNSKNKNIPYTWLFISKQILIITLILLNIVDLGIAIHKSTYEKVYNVDYCTPIIKIVTFVSIIYKFLKNYRKLIYCSNILLIFL